MKLTKTDSGNWIAEHDNLVVIGSTRLEAMMRLASLLWRMK